MLWQMTRLLLDKVASVPFLTNIANKFTIDLKRKWIKTAVKITNTSGYVASFKDLTLFVEKQPRIANSTFALNFSVQALLKVTFPEATSLETAHLKRLKLLPFKPLPRQKVKCIMHALQLSANVVLKITNCFSVASFAHFL